MCQRFVSGVDKSYEYTEFVCQCTASNATRCNQDLYSAKSQGLFTGNCSANGRCQMYSWCPPENDVDPDPVNGVGAFTAYVDCVEVL